MGAALYQQQPTPEGAPAADAGTPVPSADDGVVDAEVVDEGPRTRSDH